MTLFSYEIFDAVARQGSFNKAAQQLHLTPSCHQPCHRGDGG